MSARRLVPALLFLLFVAWVTVTLSTPAFAVATRDGRAVPIATALQPTPQTSFQLLFPVSGHDAFPSLAQSRTGEITTLYRHGTDHVAGRNGEAWFSSSSDLGQTFSTPQILKSTPGVDYRDPTIAYLRGEAWLTWFTGSAALAAEGVWVQRGSRAPVRVDRLPYAAIAAPVRLLPDASFGLVYYGRAVGESRDSIWFARSLDGFTWTNSLIASGSAAGLDLQEPWLVVRGSQLLVTHRLGNWDSVALTTSATNGRTWGAPQRILASATGRANMTLLKSGTLVLTYRHAGTRDAMLSSSRDGGLTWATPKVLMDVPDDDIGYAYGDILEVGGSLLTILSVETGVTAGLWRGMLAEKDWT